MYSKTVGRREYYKCGAKETPNATVVTYLSDEEYCDNTLGSPSIYRASANPVNDDPVATSIPARVEGASVPANPWFI